MRLWENHRVRTTIAYFPSSEGPHAEAHRMAAKATTKLSDEWEPARFTKKLHAEAEELPWRKLPPHMNGCCASGFLKMWLNVDCCKECECTTADGVYDGDLGSAMHSSTMQKITVCKTFRSKRRKHLGKSKISEAEVRSLIRKFDEDLLRFFNSIQKGGHRYALREGLEGMDAMKGKAKEVEIDMGVSNAGLVMDDRYLDEDEAAAIAENFEQAL